MKYLLATRDRANIVIIIRISMETYFYFQSDETLRLKIEKIKRKELIQTSSMISSALISILTSIVLS